MKDQKISMWIELFLMVLFFAIGVRVWGGLLRMVTTLLSARMEMYFPEVCSSILVDHPFLWAAGGVFFLNACNYVFRLSRVDDDLAGMNGGGMTGSYIDFQIVMAKLFFIITISPSAHLRAAIVAYRKSK